MRKGCTDLRSLRGMVLCGLEGSGKTRLAKSIAMYLGWRAIDADEVSREVTEALGGISHYLLRRLLRSPDHQLSSLAERYLRERRESLVATVTDTGGRAVANNPTGTTRAEIPSKPQRVVMATTLRPLFEDETRLTSVRAALDEHWIVVHVERSMSAIAKFFFDNPKEKELRERLDGLVTPSDIRNKIEEDSRELLRWYAEFRDFTVDLVGPITDDEIWIETNAGQVGLSVLEWLLRQTPRA